MKITLAPGESKNVLVAGSRFYYESGVGLINVKTLGNDSAEFDLWAGMGFQNKDGALNFHGLQITNKTSNTQDIEIFISYREVFDNRVSFDSITTVDGRLSEVIKGNRLFSAFARREYFEGVTKKMGVMLRNLSSVDNLILYKIIVPGGYRPSAPDNPGEFSIFNEAFATLSAEPGFSYGNLTGVTPLSGVGSLPFGRAQVTTFETDNMYDLPAKRLYMGRANETHKIEFDFPLIIPPLKVVAVQHSPAYINANAHFVFSLG